MNLNSIYIKADSDFSKFLNEWALNNDVEILNYDQKSSDFPEGLLLINANQDIDRDHLDIHTLFDKKHIPTQKIDVNGTLQVAVSNMEIWLNNFKCKNILILGRRYFESAFYLFYKKQKISFQFPQKKLTFVLPF